MVSGPESIHYPKDIDRVLDGPEEAFDLIGKDSGFVYNSVNPFGGDDFEKARALNHIIDSVRHLSYEVWGISENFDVKLSPRV